jgi:hypothetical protein
MKPKLPFVALWASILYQTVIVVVMSKASFDVLQRYHRTISSLKAGDPIFGGGTALNPAWVAETADAAIETLFWFALLLTAGIVATAASAVWIMLAKPLPPAVAEE